MRGKASIAACALALSGCNAYIGPTPRDANWNVVDSAHFSLHVRPGSVAEQNAATLGAVLDDQYVTTLHALQGRFDGRISAFLYNSASEAQLPGDHSGTAFADTNAFEAVVVPPVDGSVMSLVAHEANHVVIINAWGRAGTSMLNEGLPSAVLSDRYCLMGPRYYYSWTTSHRSQLPSIERLSSDAEWPTIDQNVAYSTAASFLAYVLQAHGPEKLRQLFGVRSAGFADRFAEIYGRALAVVETEWLAFCAAQG